MNTAECGIHCILRNNCQCVNRFYPMPKTARPYGASPAATRHGDPAFLKAKLVTARFYAEIVMPLPAAACSR